jgi:esterase/lipase superfamily enzyme
MEHLDVSRIFAAAGQETLAVLALATIALVFVLSGNRRLSTWVRDWKQAAATAATKYALQLAKFRYGPDHPNVGSALNDLAELYESLDRYDEAEPLYNRSLAIRDIALGPDHPDVAASLNSCAEFYRRQGRYAEAEVLHERSLAIRTKALGPDHPCVGTSLYNLAGVYRSQGRHVEAEPLYKLSLAIREKALGSDHPNVGSCLNDLALLYQEQGRHAEAEPLYKRSLAICEKAFGPDHPEVGQCLNNIAGLHCQQGRYAETEPLYERAIAIFEKASGPDHPSLAMSLNNLAALYFQQGRYAEAEPLCTRAEAMPGWQAVDIPVLFATNRGLAASDGGVAFSDEQAIEPEEITFGGAMVRALKSEVPNRAERAPDAVSQLYRAGGKQIREWSLRVHSSEAAVAGADLAIFARDWLERAVRFPGQAIVYVHGCNNSFDEAVRRTAMIAFDLDFDGAAFLFAWPAECAAHGSCGGRERADVAAPFLIEMIETIGRELPGVRVHLVAHGTGAEVVLSALERLAHTGASATWPALGELILAHADVNRARFRQLMPTIAELGLRVTSYSCAENRATWLSRILRWDGARIDQRPTCHEGVNAVDITGLGGGPLSLNHDIFVHNPMVLGDMARLMATSEHPPDKRTPFFAPVPPQDPKHWEYRPASRI